MKYLKLSYLILLLFSITTLVACNPEDENEVFDNPTAVRSQSSVSELFNTLVAQTSGYKAVYYTKSDEHGGFTIFLNFSADGTVKQTSDYLPNSEIDETLFEVRAGTTTELVFLTRNDHITEALNPLYAGYDEESPIDIGAGLKGTNNFQFFSNEDGVLTFRDVRQRNTGSLVLTPTNFANFDTESVEEIETIKDRRLNLLGPQSEISDFNTVFEVENTNGTVIFRTSNDIDGRLITISRKDQNGVAQVFSFGYHITTDGFSVLRGFEFENNTYFDFIYQEVDNSFISTVDGTTAKLFFQFDVVSNPADIEALLELGPNGFLYRMSLGANPLTSSSHDTMMSLVSSNVNSGLQNNYRVDGYQLVLDFASDDCDTNLAVQIYDDANNNSIKDPSEGYVNLFFCFEAAEINDGRLFLNYTGPSLPGTPEFTVPLVQPLLDFIGDPNGLKFSTQGDFETNIGAYSNSAGSFTSYNDADEAQIRVYGLFF